MSNETYLQRTADIWLQKFAAYLSAADLEGVISCFLPNGWLRDILTFTWSNRTLSGRDKITSYLRTTLPSVKISEVTLDGRPGLSPQTSAINPDGVGSGFTFTTDTALGQGYFHLAKDESGEWKAMVVFVTIQDLKGHEELGPELGIYDGHTLAWEDFHRERCKQIEEKPYVLIVGAGQTGLNIAARFHKMKIPSLVLESNRRVGDNWRKRYPTLSLHTPRSHHPMLYQPYPKNWPIFTPRDKLADWLEQYVSSQDLIVWTNSRPLPIPSYDFAAKRWSVAIDRDGTQVILNPVHVVLATGTLGKPRVPKMLNSDIFHGTILHASKYNGAHQFIGKHVVVIGAGNTSADVCQDLAVHGIEVTMVQRSSTCVVAASSGAGIISAWPENCPTDVSDFKFAACPMLLFKQLASSQVEKAWERERKMHEGLIKAGLKLNMGSDGSGPLPLLFERFGGYWIDVGCAKLISAGKIAIKQGVEPQGFTEEAIVFNDGSSIPVDVVIYATGYHNIRDTITETFGDETIERTGPVWGLDEEGEIRGSYGFSGHPGLWYGSGDFWNSRFSSKQLALEIKAMELGLMSV